MDGVELVPVSSPDYIDWQSLDSHLFVNRKDPQIIEKKVNLSTLPKISAHIWVPSSGSNSGFKVYAISKNSFLVSAKAVNDFLMATKSDTWLNVLPLYHVGGLSIFARAFLSQSKVSDKSSEKWSPESFHKWTDAAKATLTSLVPTQVYDLVKMKIKSPKSLRAILVGGAKLEQHLYFQAREWGFPLLPTYGMTECASQIATAAVATLDTKLQTMKKDSPEIGQMNLLDLIKLPHVKVKLTSDQILSVKSKALFTLEALWKQERREWEVLRRVGDWYTTQDVAKILTSKDGSTIIAPLGRTNEQIKISGELFSLLNLNEQFEKLLIKQEIGDLNFCILAQKNERRGHEIVLCVEMDQHRYISSLISAFNQVVHPMARIRAVYFVQNIPKSDLGKIKKKELSTQLGLN